MLRRRYRCFIKCFHWKSFEGGKFLVVGGIRLVLARGKTGDNVDLVVEEMDAKQARLFSFPDLG
jgi:hypothetical protein